jgi:hypothetical protein
MVYTLFSIDYNSGSAARRQTWFSGRPGLQNPKRSYYILFWPD